MLHLVQTQRVYQLTKQGKRNPDLLCERTEEPSRAISVKLRAHNMNEYHLIDLATGLSHGGFESLMGARQYAREEHLIAWDIFHGNVRTERHDPRGADPVLAKIDCHL